MVTSALLFLLPVVVVDVTGDRLDPAHTRKLVEPIERTIELPDDRARAETDAAFLAGNLARDEASELAPEAPAKAEKPASSVAASLVTDADRELAQLHAFVKQTSADEKSSQMRSAVVQVTASAALLGGAAVVIATEPESTEVRAAAHGAVFAGSWLLGHGFASLVFHRTPLESVERRIKEHESRRTDPREALADIEREWAKEVDDARRGRRIAGGVSIGLGAVLAGIGSALVLATDVDGEPPSAGFALIGGGGFGIVSGIGALVGESALERSHRMWRTVRTSPEPASNISLGVTVLRGGGGAASFALTF